MAKYTIKKEWTDDGEVIYRIYKDNKHIASSYSEESAENRLQAILENAGKSPIVIKEIEA